MRRLTIAFTSCLILICAPVAGLSQAPPIIHQSQPPPPLTRPTSERPSTRHISQEKQIPVLQPLAPIPSQPRLKTQQIAFKSFLHEVEHSNLDYAAQRYNVPIAEAQVTAAKVFPNPTLLGGSSFDVSHEKQATTYASGVTQTILLGGKIRARTEVAKSNLMVNAAQLEDFFRNLRATATNAYVDGLSGQLSLERKKRSLETLERLAASNQERLRAGDIGEVDLLQSRVAALQARSDFLAAQSTFEQGLIGLAALLGDHDQRVLFSPTGTLKAHPLSLELEELVASALAKRGDVLAAEGARQVARAQYNLTRANRVPDVDVGVGFVHNTRITNVIDPAPPWNSLAFTLSMPIPLSNINRGDLMAAKLGEAQADKAAEAAELKAVTEVRQAYTRYSLARAAVSQYSGELLQDADTVLEAKLYSYRRGGASLLEVLDAQRANNDTYLAYFAALSEQAKALVGLEQAAAIWDIEF
jgi:cobalt-zinc-cadmium efflux system outer membrane protein